VLRKTLCEHVNGLCPAGWLNEQSITKHWFQSVGTCPYSWATGRNSLKHSFLHTIYTYLSVAVNRGEQMLLFNMRCLYSNRIFPYFVTDLQRKVLPRSIFHHFLFSASSLHWLHWPPALKLPEENAYGVKWKVKSLMLFAIYLTLMFDIHKWSFRFFLD